MYSSRWNVAIQHLSDSTSLNLQITKSLLTESLTKVSREVRTLPKKPELCVYLIAVFTSCRNTQASLNMASMTFKMVLIMDNLQDTKSQNITRDDCCNGDQVLFWPLEWFIRISLFYYILNYFYLFNHSFIHSIISSFIYLNFTYTSH